MAYFQYQKGAIEEVRMRSALGPLLGNVSVRGRARWKRIRQNFVPAYREYVDHLIDEAGGSSDS